MLRDVTPSAIYMGLLAAFVGYSSTFAIILTGLSNVGASGGQAATGLFFSSLAMGVSSIWFALAWRIPAGVAWSLPGAAFLATTGALPGGFAEAVGALIIASVLIVLTGVLPPLARLVSAIPKTIANALLAGVLLPLCFAPAAALGDSPWIVLPVLVAWTVGLALHRLAAMPMAVAAFAVVLALASGPVAPGLAETGSGAFLPPLAPIWPEVSLFGALSVALPIYLVTMAGQNIPGFAVLELAGYEVDRRPMIRRTGMMSLLIAPFGAIPVNMSAVTAAMMCGEDAGRDRAKRYWAAVASGAGYVVLAVLAGPIAALAQAAPEGLIVAVAGLALIPALVGALSAAFAEPGRIEAPAVTFLFTASGMGLMGIGGAFWGLVAGSLVWAARRMRD